MTKIRTSDTANEIFGNKLYQRRALSALPLLVRQANCGNSISYTNLTIELGMPNPRNLDYPLGYIGKTLINLSKEMDLVIPPIQTLVVNNNSGLPGKGIAGYLKNYTKNDYKNLSNMEKKTIVDFIHGQIFSFRKWPQVLKNLGIGELDAKFQFNTPFDGFGMGGEGEAHRKLKKYVAKNPMKFGLRNTDIGKTEHSLISGDRLDVSFDGPKSWIAVEVKSHISNHDDLIRGLFQCVKYKAVMQAYIGLIGSSKFVDSILIVEGVLEPYIVTRAHALGVRFVEVKQFKGGIKK